MIREWMATRGRWEAMAMVGLCLCAARAHASSNFDPALLGPGFFGSRAVTEWHGQGRRALAHWDMFSDGLGFRAGSQVTGRRAYDLRRIAMRARNGALPHDGRGLFRRWTLWTASCLGGECLSRDDTRTGTASWRAGDLTPWDGLPDGPRFSFRLGPRRWDRLADDPFARPPVRWLVPAGASGRLTVALVRLDRIADRSPSVAPAPIPAPVTLLGSGLLGLVGFARRRPPRL